MDWPTVLACAMTGIGLLVSSIQTYRVKKLSKRNREQLEMFIEDANYVSFEHEIIDELAQELDDQMIVRFLVSSHQRGCDLYRSLVDFYLSSRRRFTFSDLQRVCQTPLVTYRWQEKFWKGRVAMRPENNDQPVPQEQFLEEAGGRRFKLLQDKESLSDYASEMTKETGQMS